MGLKAQLFAELAPTLSAMPRLINVRHEMWGKSRTQLKTMMIPDGDMLIGSSLLTCSPGRKFLGASPNHTRQPGGRACR